VDNYRDQQRKPPCLENGNGLCFTGRPPLRITPENRLACNLYQLAATLSGVDAHTAPRLDKLETALDYFRESIEILQDEFVLDRIAQIHSIVTPSRIAKYLAEIKSVGR